MTDTFSHPFINDQSKIWRFANFTKFVSLLDTESLFFCRSDKLGDPFEGSMPVKMSEDLKKEFYKDEIVRGKMGYAKMNEELLISSSIREMSREWFYVNCWHVNEYESVAMWSLYTHSGQAIAIRTTIKRLRDSLPQQFRGNKIFIRPVQYIDFENDIIPTNTFWENRLLHKRKSFEHEEELRAFYNIDYRHDKPVEDGFYIGTNLDVLIDTIYVGPGSPEWFLNLVQDVCKKYGIDRIPARTSLDNRALY